MPAAKSPAPALAYFTAFFYILFSLYPDSHSLMVAWSWVFVWQVGLFCPMLWFLVELWDNRRLYLLGNGFDQMAIAILLAIGISTIGAEFPAQARWYAWASLDFLAGLYPISRWLNNPLGRYRIFLGQGYLSLAFVGVSLALWFSQTFLPELNRLRDLGLTGNQLKVDFSVLELRNWAPLGHQNYVAGYLILCLPMLLGLAILHRDWRRWLWLAGFAIGGIDLYTTSSRGGWFGMAIASVAAFFIAWNFSKIRKLWLSIFGFGSVGMLAIFALTNNRLSRLILPILRGEGLGELDYRWINAQVGWHMGMAHPFTGAGLGNVPLLYQKYRPMEAGRLSEIIYQLHSTPVQLWAEMGTLGIGLFVGSLIFLLIILWKMRSSMAALSRQDRILLGSIYTGLIGYWAMSLTDFQLDNVCISGVIIIFVAIIAAIARQDEDQQSLPAEPVTTKLLGKTRIVTLGIIGVYGAIAMWIIPIHIAWEKSSSGFAALTQEQPDYETFKNDLEDAHALTPWESYYAHQLGWNIGALALQTQNPESREIFFKDAIQWFEQANVSAPYREFGRTNLAWLHVATQNPGRATEEFLQASQLVPAKRGVFYGLGLSLLEQGQTDQAIEAIAIEILRDPIFITSPIWRSSGLGSFYPAIVKKVIGDYEQLLNDSPENELLHRSRGALAWWTGNFELAAEEFQNYGFEGYLSLLEPVNSDETGAIPLLRTAFAEPEKRLDLINQLWEAVGTSAQFNDAMRQQFLASMEQASTFDEWLRLYSPIWQYSRERAGFNVISRHIDGPVPTDFLTVAENVTVASWLKPLFPSVIYKPSFDRQIHPLREKLWRSLSN